ncbi:SGNH/GDSL hydrolase family protein [Reichenbachiella sp. MALMAid0571]|uniref:SGNH/GDSL hydrolase family protein n=1 Tax=Reichenbachiella sp. MALMAid0571 TaxID=3143939 RepID=UPI0032DFBAE3
MKNPHTSLFLIAVFFFLNVIHISAQDPERFKDQVEMLSHKKYKFKKQDEVILFTGSSSIRMWKNIQEYFPDKNVINTGFGGSQMSDLLFYSKALIFKYSPNKVFIYEGDNDLNDNKSPDEIMATTKTLVAQIEAKLKGVEIIFISPKPSLSRWPLKEKYEALNRMMEDYCNTKESLFFANVWEPMLGENGKPMEDLFIQDGLHMKPAGYDIWAKVIKEFLY